LSGFEELKGENFLKIEEKNSINLINELIIEG
jgi:hypothetical protein